MWAAAQVLAVISGHLVGNGWDCPELVLWPFVPGRLWGAEVTGRPGRGLAAWHALDPRGAACREQPGLGAGPQEGRRLGRVCGRACQLAAWGPGLVAVSTGACTVLVTARRAAGEGLGGPGKGG